MTTRTSTSRSPGPLRRLFLSPDEARLRAGWRLILHSFLTLALLFCSILPVALFVAASGEIESLSADTPLALGLPSVATLLAITLATWLARRVFDRRSFASLGLALQRHTLPDLGLGFLLAGLVMAVVFGIEYAAGWLDLGGGAWTAMPWGSVFLSLVGSLALYAAVGFEEELLSRGYHLQNLAEGLNLPWGVFLSSSVFAVLHLRNPHASLLSTLGILTAGLFLAFAWIRTRQLWLSIGLHIGWNFFEGTVFGFPVSGIDGFHLIRHTVTGPTLLTGGPFGPEAGLVILPALFLAAVCIAAYTRRRIPPE